MQQSQNKKVSSRRGYWLWVTRPANYLDEDGVDREDLDPKSGIASDGWWTCHQLTKKGDLVFLWRTTPKRDIAYLIQAKSDAYSITDDEYASEMNWDYCIFSRRLTESAYIRVGHEGMQSSWLCKQSPG